MTGLILEGDSTIKYTLQLTLFYLLTVIYFTNSVKLKSLFNPCRYGDHYILPYISDDFCSRLISQQGWGRNVKFACGDNSSKTAEWIFMKLKCGLI